VNGIWPSSLRFCLRVEFARLLTGLITYPVLSVAEVVRGGIAAVPAASGKAAHFPGTATGGQKHALGGVAPACRDHSRPQ